MLFVVMYSMHLVSKNKCKTFFQQLSHKIYSVVEPKRQ